MRKYPKRRISAREVTRLLLEDSEDDFDTPDSPDDLQACGDGPWVPDNHHLSDSQESSSESDCDNSRDGNSDLENLVPGSNDNASDPTSSTDVSDPNNGCQPTTSTNVDPVPSTSTVANKPTRPQNCQPPPKRNNARNQKRKNPSEEE
nr:PREDICTED: uncharacterized protein LOC109031978 [Bemisia tabaci]